MGTLRHLIATSRGQPDHATELSRCSVDQLRTELAQLTSRSATTRNLADQLARHGPRGARRCAPRTKHLRGRRTRAARGGLLRRRTGDPTALAFERERLKLAEHHAAVAAERERELAAQVPDRATWQAERRALRERAAELETQLSIRRREHLYDALERPAPYLLASLGELPDQPRARRTWRQAAQRIEAYRFDHAITDNQDALGPRPAATPARDTGSKPARPPASTAPPRPTRQTRPRTRALTRLRWG